MSAIAARRCAFSCLPSLWHLALLGALPEEQPRVGAVGLPRDAARLTAAVVGRRVAEPDKAAYDREGHGHEVPLGHRRQPNVDSA
eukprot:2671263-Lingulodinium_polyedra.AAC.1